MKKIFNGLFILAMVAICAMFTSCDKDVDRSIALSGQWKGDFGMYYTFEYKGQWYKANSYNTDIVFYPHHDYATYGTGIRLTGTTEMKVLTRKSASISNGASTTA